MTSLNEQQKRTIALQACGEYLMNRIAGGVEMVQDQCVRKDRELGEETLIPIETPVSMPSQKNVRIKRRDTLLIRRRSHFVKASPLNTETKGQER